MGYSVDVLTFPRNVCRSKEEVLRVAEGLRVSLDPSRLRYFNNVTQQAIFLRGVRAYWRGAGESLCIWLASEGCVHTGGVLGEHADRNDGQ